MQIKLPADLTGIIQQLATSNNVSHASAVIAALRHWVDRKGAQALLDGLAGQPKIEAPRSFGKGNRVVVTRLPSRWSLAVCHRGNGLELDLRTRQRTLRLIPVRSIHTNEVLLLLAKEGDYSQ